MDVRRTKPTWWKLHIMCKDQTEHITFRQSAEHCHLQVSDTPNDVKATLHCSCIISSRLRLRQQNCMLASFRESKESRPPASGPTNMFLKWDEKQWKETCKVCFNSEFLSFCSLFFRRDGDGHHQQEQEPASSSACCPTHTNRMYKHSCNTFCSSA